MIEVVSATRRSEKDFWASSPLGLSLRRLSFDTRISSAISFENSRGLPERYNARIAAAHADTLLVFIHDDVWIDDYFFADRVIEGLTANDVLGVAGNRRRNRFQPAWIFADPQFTRDDKANLSGAVAHGQGPFGMISHFGPVPAACELLDGVFLAAKAGVLRDHHVAFEPALDFHLYDMDFCRSAQKAGLSLSTWPICLTHVSGGAFGSEPWLAAFRTYIEKWKE